ncbi:MAG: serine/threonine-protein kinase [Acidobacteria bacterium]|nr:serine/threonine-protein kinase [Acidobacteriota bacterium]
MALAAGSRIGPYEIQAVLGAGGMGEVYRARDTKLDRDVAIKILPEAFARDPDRVARFEREAKTLASLNHPNIGAIYGLEEGSGVVASGFSRTDVVRAIVMELVEGLTLAERIAQGPIPVEEVLPIARQIADALEAAHEHGVVHRDLKPGNIKVTVDGKVKVLDFGLAKLVGPAEAGHYAPSGGLTASPTLSVQATVAGVILGTAAYMSPEQARGKPVDRRADIWAFGCVLYEMLTGKQAFAAGETVSDAIAAILKNEPDWSALPAETPAAVRMLLRRCLQKDPQKRLPHIGAARIELEEGEHAPAEATRAADGRASARRRERLMWAAALVGVVVIAAVAIAWALRPAPSPPEMRVEINTPPTNDLVSHAISPDGQRLVFVAPDAGQPKLWLRSLDSTTVQPLPGTEAALYPFWSPDSRSVAFFAGGALKRLEPGGGPPQTLAAAPAARGGTWGEGGAILFAATSGGPLLRTSATGGEVVPVTTLADGQVAHRFPQFLPGGRRFLFYATGTENVAGIHLGSIDRAEMTRVTPADSAGRYLHPGWLVFSRQGTLLARRFDPTRGELVGDPRHVADAVVQDVVQAIGAFSVSTTGTLTYRIGGTAGRQLTWFDRSGKIVGTLGPADNTLDEAALSPDGRRVAVRRTVQDNSDIWLIDSVRTTRFTFDRNVELYPLWSPDGSRLVFTRMPSLYVKSSSGAGTDELLLKVPLTSAAQDWSSDGRFVLYNYVDPKTGGDLSVLPMDGDRKPFVFVNSTFHERLGQFSPDGRWVAYQSDESGRYEIYVRPFPGPGGQWQVSTSGGVTPRWRADGRELFYIAPDGTLTAAPIIVNGAAVEPGAPVALFRPRIVWGGTNPIGVRWQYDVAPDGRFLINVVTEEASASPITLILNWNPERQ